MATRTIATAPDNSTDANFRAWAKEINDALIAAGWVNTAATGTINFTTVLKPALANTIQGFAVYRMADTLQATKPCFLKIEFGSAGAQTQPLIFITIGTAHDGAGNLTGSQVSPRWQLNAGGNSASTFNCYSSGSSSSFHLAMWGDWTTSAFWFVIERSKDTSGVDTGSGIIIYNGQTSAVYRQLFIPDAGGVPVVETLPQCALSTSAPTTFGGNKGVGIPFPTAGANQNPGLGCLFVRNSDFIELNTYAITVYGASHTYLRVKNTAAAPGNILNVAAFLMLRWE